MKNLKRYISLIVAILLIVCALPLQTVNAATTLTEEQFATKLAAVKKEYPNDKYWNEYNGTTKIGSLNVAKAGNKVCSGTSGGNTCVSNGYCARYETCTCKCGSFHGWQCHGFANLVAYKVFGSYATNWTNASSNSDVNKNWEWHKSVSKYYAGDFVRLTTGHSVFIIKVTSSRVYTVDCNRTGPCQIDWNNSYTISEFKSKTKFVVHYKNNTLTGTGSTTHTLTIQYNANGGTLAGNTYTVTTDGDVGLWLRSSYSTSSSKLVLIPDDTKITVTETKTSGGYTWGKTTYSGKTGWCALSVGAVKSYYLSSNIVYGGVSKKACTTVWNYGSGGKNGLYNSTTFELTKKGYAFKGWSLSTDGSSTVFDQDDVSLKAESIYPDVKNKDATVTLYAIWEPLQKTISNIEIVNMPKKTEYYIGDTLELDGLNLKINYTDGSYAAVEKYSVSEFDSSKEGTKTLKVSYGDVFTNFEVTVKEPSVKVQENISLAVGKTANVIATADPSNAEIDYYSSDSSVFEVANGKLTAIANGTATLYCEITVNDNTYISKCVVKVGTGVKEDNTDNRVDTKPVLNSISIAEMPQKTEYKIGDRLDTTGLKIQLNYSDGSNETVEKGFSVSGFDSAFEGEKTLTVKYNDCTVTYKITVYNSVTDKWQRDGTGWWYQYSDGGYAIGWAQIGNVWYYFNASGYMQTGWQVIGSSWYYFYDSGVMAANCYVDGYWLTSSGAMATPSWQLDGNGWWYSYGDGTYAVGWVAIGGTWYYFNQSGYMLLNIWIDGYYLSASGAMTTPSWQQDANGWWYSYGDGTYATGWAVINGSWYYFNASGYMVTGWLNLGGTWYYMSGSGAMVTGWQYIVNVWYYFYADGSMALNCYIEGYWLTSSGAMQENSISVVDAVNYTKEVITSPEAADMGMSYAGCYHNIKLPKLSSDTANAKEFNKKLYNTFGDEYEELLDNLEAGHIYGSDYEYKNHNGIIGIVIYTGVGPQMGGYTTHYNCFYYDTVNDCELTFNEYLSALNISKSQLWSTVKSSNEYKDYINSDYRADNSCDITLKECILDSKTATVLFDDLCTMDGWNKFDMTF